MVGGMAVQKDKLMLKALMMVDLREPPKAFVKAMVSQMDGSMGGHCSKERPTVQWMGSRTALLKVRYSVHLMAVEKGP